MSSGAIITNTTQRLGVFTVHELGVTRRTAACADFLIRLLFHAHSLTHKYLQVLIRLKT